MKYLPAVVIAGLFLLEIFWQGQFNEAVKINAQLMATIARQNITLDKCAR